MSSGEIEYDPAGSEKVIFDTINFRNMNFDGFRMSWDTAALAAVCQLPETSTMGMEVTGYAYRVADVAKKIGQALNISGTIEANHQAS